MLGEQDKTGPSCSNIFSVKRFVLFLFITLISSNLLGGKYVAEFTEIGISARATGMGVAFCSEYGGAQSQFYNPAGFAGSNSGYLMHAMLYDNLFNVDVGSFAWQLGKPTFAISLSRFASDDIPFTLEDGYFDWGSDGIPGTNDADGTEGNGIKDPGEPVRGDAFELRSEGDYLVILGAAYPVLKRLDIGVNAKYLHHDIGGYTSNGFGLDFGAIYKLNNRTNIGASLKDAIGTKIIWSTDFQETKPPTLDIGMSHNLPLAWSNFLFAGGLETKFENSDALLKAGSMSMNPHLGTEVTLFQLLSLRVGLDGNDFTAGAGLNILNFQVDYAFLSNELDNSHRIGLSFNMPQIRKGETEPPVLAEKPEEPIVVVKAEEPVIDAEEPIVNAVDLLPEDKAPVSGDILAEIHFLVGNAELSADAEKQIQVVFNLMEKYPALILDIEGHTDNTPIDTDLFPDNQALSLARAEKVMNFMLEAGISRVRLSATGLGETKMRFSGKNRFRNRRVEIVVH